MEMVLKNGFCEMTMEESCLVDGGSQDAAQAILIVGGAVSLIAGIVY